MKPISIVLIRENAEQVTGSGCCGKLEGEGPLFDQEEVFHEARQCQRDVGALHRTVREFFSKEQVSLVTVDPRNQLYLFAKLWADVVRYRPGLRASLRTCLQLFSTPAVVVNGQVLGSGNELLAPDDLCHHVRDLLETAARSTAAQKN